MTWHITNGVSNYAFKGSMTYPYDKKRCGEVDGEPWHSIVTWPIMTTYQTVINKLLLSLCQFYIYMYLLLLFILVDSPHIIFYIYIFFYK